MEKFEKIILTIIAFISLGVAYFHFIGDHRRALLLLNLEFGHVAVYCIVRNFIKKGD